MQPLPAFSTNTGENRPPTVFITHEYAPFRGGVATYVREVAAAACRLGLPVEVWAVNYQGRGDLKSVPGKTDLDHQDEGFSTVRLRSNGRLTPWGLLTLTFSIWQQRSRLAGKRVVLASVGAQMAFFLLAVLGVHPGGETICFFHGSEVLRFRRNTFWRMLSRRFYAHADTRLAASTHYVRKLLLGSGLPPLHANVELAPCALPEMFHVEQEALPRGDTSFLSVLTVARLHPRKGLKEVAQALSMLPQEYRRRIIYRVVGTGDEAYKQEVWLTCNQGGVRVKFCGALDDRKLAENYAAAALYVQASRTLTQSVEGFGITFLEAGVHGCPAAAWRSGGVGEAVLDGRTGLLVEEGDIAGLTNAVLTLLTDPPLRRKLGEAAKLHARSFHWEDAARVLCGCPAEK